MLEAQVPGGPRTFLNLWIEKFAVTCDIIFRYVVMPTMLAHDVSFFYDCSSGDREAAAKLKSYRGLANNIIAGLYQSLGHDNEARWGNKGDIPVIMKIELLGKRKRTHDELAEDDEGIFGRGGHPPGVIQD